MKKKAINKVLLFTALCIFSAGINAQWNSKVYYAEINTGKTISENPLEQYVSDGKETGKEPKIITLYPDITYQTLEGIGGSFNEIGGEALKSLPQEMQDEVMKSMFDPDEGAGFTLCRTAVGASDFGIDAYSYSEKAGDYTMEHFSIDRDKKYVLPYIQSALKYNPDLSVFASPWSPPGWMKESGMMDRGVEFPKKNILIDKIEIYEAYALYFSHYIQAYAKEGVEIDRLIIQNEPDVHTKYPSCLMTPEKMATFARYFLRPQFKKDQLRGEIWAGTFRTAQQLDAIEFAANPKLRETVDGIGMQYTRPQYIQEMKQLYPEARMMHTEGACHHGENSIEHGIDRLEEVAGYINYGVPNYCYWNMILNETGESGWDWKQNSLININRETKKVTYNPDFAAMCLISRFLRPGSLRIASFSRSTLISVKDGEKIILLVSNPDAEANHYECRIGQESVQVTVPANAISAIILKK